MTSRNWRAWTGGSLKYFMSAKSWDVGRCRGSLFTKRIKASWRPIGTLGSILWSCVSSCKIRHRFLKQSPLLYSVLEIEPLCFIRTQLLEIWVNFHRSWEGNNMGGNSEIVKWNLSTYPFYLFQVVWTRVIGIDERFPAIKNCRDHHAEGEHVWEETTCGGRLNLWSCVIQVRLSRFWQSGCPWLTIYRF